jgi:hypothetical protein
MNKRLSVIVALFFCLTLSLFAGKADEKKLLKLVPAGAEAVVSVDITDWLTLPALKKGLAESPDAALIRKKTGVSPDDLSAALFWAKEDTWALVIQVKKPFEPEKLFRAPDFRCVKVTAEGETLYNVSSVKPVKVKKVQKKPVSFWIGRLPGNTVVFSQDAAMISQALKEMKSNPKGFVFPADVTGSLRGVVKGGQLPMQQLLIGCQMTGKERDAFSGVLHAAMNSQQEAEQMQGQAMLMCNLLLVQLMQNEPDLAADLMKQLKFSVKENVISLNVVLPGALLDRLGKFAAKRSLQKSIRKKTKKTVPAAAK